MRASGAGRPIRAGEGRDKRPPRSTPRVAGDAAPERPAPRVGAGGRLGEPAQAGSRSRQPRFGAPARPVGGGGGGLREGRARAEPIGGGGGLGRRGRTDGRWTEPQADGEPGTVAERRRWRPRCQRRRRSERCWRRSSAGCCTTRCTQCSGSCRTSSRRPRSASLCHALVQAPRGLPSRRTSSLAAVDQVKGVLTLQGDALSQADVNLKIPRNNQLLHFAFREDKQWKLQQIQDARNHVSQAIYLLANRDENYQFRTGAEVLKLMDAVMLQLTRARNRLTTPATLTLPEIAASGLTRMFAPALPSDLLVNVYINLNKLCLTVYQLHALQPNSTKNFRPAGGAVLHSPGAMFEWGSQRLEVSHVHKVECVIPWLNDALVFFTVSLQLCQQLKDKISVFSSYWSYRPF
ncbi:protein rogdi homolog isoform X1 [Mirounga angustirostris]|uniref:protein rogdi homolog isoform X1 n=1 Tax=Mirounga angustirostris TaxID=9716 RepID=UPI00313D21A3